MLEKSAVGVFSLGGFVAKLKKGSVVAPQEKCANDRDAGKSDRMVKDTDCQRLVAANPKKAESQNKTVFDSADKTRRGWQGYSCYNQT